MKGKFALCVAVTLTLAKFDAYAQSGGDFAIRQSVISSGGGVSSDGGSIFSATGVVGQPAAGTRMSNPPFSVAGGFFVSDLAPTAATVSVGGRVFDSEGRAVSRAVLTLNDSTGATRTARTNSFGYFRFDEVRVGETYVIEVRHKRYAFSPRVVTVSDEIADLEFIGLEN